MQKKRNDKKEGVKPKKKSDNQTVDGWELTVGIEIHAQLNTARKLFSHATASSNDDPNTHVALFDLSIPGSQPLFQEHTLIPALRAALALNCEIQPVSRFDRKHYFWWDQPAGYQITQYYEPFSRNGHLTLLARDGIAAEDGEGAVLNSVDACVSGMELGGLRADVNVSVRRTGDPATPLGTRTEIKNLNTIKAVEDAIIAERDRQIAELEAGRHVAGETRGWTLGSKETRRLRGKEGEVDYRYMPDPDLAPVIISRDLVECLRQTVTAPPDTEVDALISEYGLTAKDALSLLTLENGGRVEYFYNVVDKLGSLLAADGDADSQPPPEIQSYSTLAGNWILHELGKLTTEKGRVPVDDLAELLHLLHRGRITGKVAKQLLISLYNGDLADAGGVAASVEAHDLWFRELSEDEYAALAESIVEGNRDVLDSFRKKGPQYPQGKLMFLVGKMMREGATERIHPAKAEAVLKAKIAAVIDAEKDE
ncbi:unnamed protein product [Parascedosporium putredinis]|uniref:Asn/Gln amidotransferase domain-containing protein n=1 Tax=Parascedosporium putredinis TaxID=1442378 RepID=A0A9P1MBG8_9PEZI|nr:unnamed protein product [Parascedosporium putredinis]CAI7996195.1 unnamed protein product [Parascedosporium putredinis]